MPQVDLNLLGVVGAAMLAFVGAVFLMHRR